MIDVFYGNIRRFVLFFYKVCQPLSGNFILLKRRFGFADTDKFFNIVVNLFNLRLPQNAAKILFVVENAGTK